MKTKTISMNNLYLIAKNSIYQAAVLVRIIKKIIAHNLVNMINIKSYKMSAECLIFVVSTEGQRRSDPGVIGG